MNKLIAMVSIYNSGKWIKNRLDNLVQSSMFDNMEIWCVNADSPSKIDHDIPIEYANRYKNIIYRKLDERINVYATWNYIIQNSDGDFVTNANTDDIVSPMCYEKLVATLNNNQSHDFAYPSWLTTDIDNQQWPPHNVDYSGQPGNFAGNIERAGVGHFPLWRKSLHDRFGLFDDQFQALADADWWMRCYHVGGCGFQWVNEYLACYLWRDGSDGTDRNLWHRAINSDEWERFHKKCSEYRG